MTISGDGKKKRELISVQFSSVAQLCLTLCDPMDCSTPGLPIHHQLLELTQIHVHWVEPRSPVLEADALTSEPPGKPICPLSQWCHPTISSSVIRFSSRFQSFPALAYFQMSLLFTSGGQSIEFSTSPSVLPMNIQDWSLGWTGWISLLSKGLSRVFSNGTVQKHQFFGAQLFYSPSLTSIHDYWKNHSFNQTDLCWQSNVSAFNMLSRLVITFLPRSFSPVNLSHVSLILKASRRT